MATEQKPGMIQSQKGRVYCPSCTHTVEAEVLAKGKRQFTRPGQKCARCASTLDAAYILYLDKVAA